MSTIKVNRIYYYYNLRFLLITTVVIRHFINPLTSGSAVFKSIFLWIYSFHMPLFLFISGLFHKNEHILPKVMRFLMIGIVLKICLFLVGLIMNGTAALSFYGMDGIPWYMFVLAGYTVLSYMLRKMNKYFILVFSIILGLFSGYDSTLGDMFLASRFIVFYPFLCWVRYYLPVS